MKRTRLVAFIAIVCLAILAVLVTVWPSIDHQIQNKKQLEARYQTAMSALKEEDYIRAYEELAELRNYKDSKQQAIDIRERYYAEKLDGISLGETVYLGRLEGMPLTWTVAALRDGYAILVCDAAVANKQYHNSGGSYRLEVDAGHYNEWSKCDLRNWLNEDFMSSFSDSERVVMQKATVPSGGMFKIEQVVCDYVYILSEQELKAAAQAGWDRNGKLRSASFWLRGSAGTNGIDAMGHNVERRYGWSNLTELHGVIPVVWVWANTVNVPETSVFDVGEY
jgi:hypothetical protein